MQGKRLEVLHDGCKVELVACAGEPAQPEPLEAMVGLQVCKAHLDPLPLVTRPANAFVFIFRRATSRASS